MDFKAFRKKYQKVGIEEISSCSSQLPLVSVLVQTYNQKNFIKKCIESILTQRTSFDFEILIGEDDSNDGTREICFEYAQNHYKNICLFLHNRENNINVLGEPTANFNALYNFFSAKGKYIAVCEGDDLWSDPTKLQKQVDFLEANQEYSFSYHSYSCINEFEEKTIVTELIQPKKDLEQEELLKVEYHPLLLTMCFRNNFRQLPAELTEVINVDTFLISMLGQFGKGKFQEEILPSLYRRHSSGIWSKRALRKKYKSKILLFAKLSSYYKKAGSKKISLYFSKKKMNVLRSQIHFDIKKGDLISAGSGTFSFLKAWLNKGV